MAFPIGAILGGLSGLLGGGGKAPTTSTGGTNTPWRQDERFDPLISGASGYLNRPGSTIAGFDPLQTQGQNMAMTAANNPLIAQQGGALGMMLNPGMLNPESNPYLAATVQGGIGQVFQNLLENVMPQIQSGATQTGNVGSSRQGIAQGRAIEGATRGAMDYATQAYMQNYQQQLANMLGASGQTTNAIQNALYPSMIMQDVGAQRQNLQQQMLNEPLQRLGNYQNLISGNMGGSTTGTSTGAAPQHNPLMAGIGGALSGIGLQNQLSFPGGGQNFAPTNYGAYTMNPSRLPNYTGMNQPGPLPGLGG